MVDFQAYRSIPPALGMRLWQPNPYRVFRSRRPREIPSDSSDSDSDVDLPIRRKRQPQGGSLIARRQRNREGMINRGCECDSCIKLDPENKKTTFRQYDDVDPKGKPPGDTQHFFSLCDRSVYAFALKERSFGKSLCSADT